MSLSGISEMFSGTIIKGDLRDEGRRRPCKPREILVMTFNFSCKPIREMSRYFGGKLRELEIAFGFFFRGVAWPVNYLNRNI